jgi:hypothetical protein
VFEVRKAAAFLLAGLIVLTAAASLAGCGQSGKDKALQHINRGDSFAYKMSAKADNLRKVLDNFFTTLQGPNPEAVASPGGPIEQYSATLQEVNDLAHEMELEYQEVMSLGGVEEEKEYASLMIEVSRKTVELMDTIAAWFDKVLDVLLTRDEKKIRSYLTGDEFKAGLKQIEEMRGEIEKAAGKAKDYRIERDF